MTGNKSFSNPNRIVNLNMNCTKEHGWEIVNKYAQDEFNHLQSITFPFPEIDIKRCTNEWKTLLKNNGDLNPTGYSPIIRGMHPSMYYASKDTNKSPVDYWKVITSDFEEFKRFYFNRLTRSDWFKRYNRKEEFMELGKVPLEIYFCGLTTSGKAPCVGYFKPKIAKYITLNYLKDFNTIFDPFSGYSGRMLGVLASGKNYIGQDLNNTTVNESINIYNFIKTINPNVPNCTVINANTITSSGNYEALMTCSPYDDLEDYKNDNEVNYSCSEWIDICMKNFNCKRYIFVTDEKIRDDHKKHIVNEIKNISHWGKNSEYILLFDK